MNQQVKNAEEENLEKVLNSPTWPSMRAVMLEQLVRLGAMIDTTSGDVGVKAGKVCGVARLIQNLDNQADGGASNG